MEMMLTQRTWLYIHSNRNKEQERRRKRAEEYLKPTIKHNQIYPLINGQVRTSEPGEVTLLPRNHHLERADPEIEDEPELIRREIEKKRRARLCGAGCGLTKSEYKHMIMTPKDKNRERRFHHPRHEDLEKAYGLRFPACFFALYEFACEVDHEDPLNCMTKIGLQLGGAFEEFHKMARNKTYQPEPKHKIFRNLVNRHYWDPPEFQILMTNVKDRSHVGYWRDHPDELPPFVVRNDGYQGKLYVEGPNLLASTKLWLYRRTGSQSLHARKCFATISDIALKWNIIIERVTYELRERETRCNARTLNTVGISVPIVQDAKGNEMGYRPLEIDDLELEQICTDIDVAESDKERLKHFKPMQDLFRRVNIANDECDYGMGLEFGISLFAHGSKYFHKMILKVLPQTYRLLGRDFYAEILEAHLADRRKQLCDRADIAPISRVTGPKMGMFRVEVENPPEDVAQSQAQAAAALEYDENPVEEPEPEIERNQYLENLRRTTITQPVVRGPRPKAASSDWG